MTLFNIKVFLFVAYINSDLIPYFTFNQFIFLLKKNMLFIVQGLVVSVVLLTLDCLVCTELLFIQSLSIDVK